MKTRYVNRDCKYITSTPMVYTKTAHFDFLSSLVIILGITTLLGFAIGLPTLLTR